MTSSVRRAATRAAYDTSTQFREWLQSAVSGGILLAMGFGVRVVLRPLVGVATDRTRVDGARFALENFGAAGSAVTIAPQPARLTLIGTFFDAARAPAATEVRVLGVLDGTIERAAERPATFTGDGNGFTGVDSTLDVFRSPNPPRVPREQQTARVLRFRFDAPDLTEVLPNAETETELLISIDPKTVRFLEIGVKLEIAGLTEADETANARLDIPVTATNPPLLQLLSVRLHDAAAMPFPGAAAHVTLPDRGLDLVADGDGFVTFLLPPACPASIGLDWGAAPGDQPLHADLAIDCSPRADGSEAVARLQNLGYPALENLALSVKAFQRAYEVDHRPQPIGLLIGDLLPPRTRAKLQAIFANGCDATPTVAEES